MGPADTVGPPPFSVTLGVAPKLKVYLSVVVTVILNPEAFSNVDADTPPGLPLTFLNLTVSLELLP